MAALTRIGDTGTGSCNSHDDSTPYTTTFTSGAATVFANNIAVCVVGSVGSSTCGHETVAATGSSNVFAENVAVHRVGDVGANGGPYTATTGSPNVNANG